ncbi:putative Cytochrome c [Vibrio nigripulchritudo MADA3029]|uniref:Putative Cytochrome c n=1 Tax=Vibrio nigripulchritudo TaxID=28173 RepID=U4JWA5_9VIBR|nr:c-type cytochrome [Vibrio nigripulchritudo]KJY80636.1 hypothetical protein TW74_03480 [Vibrio nigripulchritudo]CCN49448.1 putative Cytochrome c [Vibrio nigripulchritudo MADA3020]CCN53754.1 putative Cytochrome c [Vibrio nigripulchritudo MADA3021]CCN58886.1 putative Cytochrome c [Vibrio nigripulchritudo MADA3029]CCN83762.1 putative Cytochrome c [Vibrio nigripulchritudo BLFn1]
MRCILLLLVLAPFAQAKALEQGEVLEQSKVLELGKEVYQTCLGCHSPTFHRTGPRHCFLFGKEVGSQKNYRYSQAMLDSESVWNAETLDRFLENPRKTIPGTKMTVAGIKDSGQREAVIIYLKSLNHESEECIGLDNDG